MKKLISILLVLLLSVAAFTALAEETATPAPEATETVVPAEDAPEEEETPGYFANMVRKLTSLKWYTIVILAALVLVGAGLIVGAKKTSWNSRRIAYAAMCLAISFVLSLIRLYEMPQGGSITPASMLPLILFTLAAGGWRGLVVGCAYGFLQLIQDPFVVHPVQLLVDYPLAFGAVALSAVALLLPVSMRWKLPIAVVLTYIGRYAMAVTSGTVFFAEYAGEQNALIYSLGYNVLYLGPDMLVCLLVSFLPGLERIVKMLKAEGN